MPSCMKTTLAQLSSDGQPFPSFATHRGSTHCSLPMARGCYHSSTYQPGDLSRRLSHVMFQREGQVRLVEVTRLEGRVENRDALLQQPYRLPGAFDLAIGVVRQPRRLQEAALHRSQR